MEATVDQPLSPNPAPLAVVAFLAPWFFVSTMLPSAYAWQAFGLLTLLGCLLACAAAWSFAAAQGRGQDPTHWAFVTILTFGFAMFFLFGKRPEHSGLHCLDCGRQGSLSEPFCFGCGSSS